MIFCFILGNYNNSQKKKDDAKHARKNAWEMHSYY